MHDFTAWLEDELTRAAREQTRWHPLTVRLRPIRSAVAMGVAVALVAVIAVGTLLLVGGHDQSSKQAGSALEQHQAPVRRPVPRGPVSRPIPRPIWALAQRFAVLNGPTAKLPPAIAAPLRPGPKGPDDGLLFDDSHRVVLSTATVWIIPGARALCVATVIAHPSPEGTSCDTRAAALRDGVRGWGGSGDAGPAFAAGVVPNGISAAVIRLTNGKTITADVHHNVYAARFTGDLRSVHLLPKLATHNFPTNAAGQTYGSSAGAPAPAQEPQLIAASGHNTAGQIVNGYVRRWQLNEGSCGNVKSPPAAIRCDKTHNHPRTIPLLARNGTTVIGHFTTGG